MESADFVVARRGEERLRSLLRSLSTAARDFPTLAAQGRTFTETSPSCRARGYGEGLCLRCQVANRCIPWPHLARPMIPAVENRPRWGTTRSQKTPDTLPQPRHHEPAPNLSKRAGDDFAWLYRQRHFHFRRSKRRPADTSAAAGCASLVSRQSSACPSTPARAAPRGRNPAIIMIVILLCLTVGAVAGMALLLQSDWRISAPGSGESSAQQAASSDAPHSGQVATLTPSSGEQSAVRRRRAPMAPVPRSSTCPNRCLTGR